MTFVSLTFIVFFACVLLSTRLGISWRAKKTVLLAASYVFYAAWNPMFVFLLLGSTAVDWVLAKKMYSCTSTKERKPFMVASLLVNLGVLAGFKYAGLFVATASTVMGKSGADAFTLPSIILPVGISFYTFQTLSYSIDVYRGRLKPANDVVDYALYVSFFPQLVAGPIVRAETFLPQCEKPRLASVDEIAWGISLFIFGLFLKVVLADAIFAPASEALFSVTGSPTFVDAWAGTFAFAGQILCDFSGYSLCAIGIAATLGFALPDNFFRPYAAVGFSDFWRRWHISLSTWLRDYLYISLGGNRHGRARTALALAVTMCLGGLWHGASWTFLAWGALHALFLVVERVLRNQTLKMAFISLKSTRFALGVLTFVLVCVAWVPFRAPTFARTEEIWRAMGGIEGFGNASASLLDSATTSLALVSIAILLLVQISTRNIPLPILVRRTPVFVRAVVIALFIIAIVLAPSDDRAFLYFQF